MKMPEETRLQRRRAGNSALPISDVHEVKRMNWNKLADQYHHIYRNMHGRAH